MIVRRLTCPNCHRTWTVMAGDMNYACPGCGSTGEPAETEHKAGTGGPTDGERLLIALRARGAAGIHSHEIRKLGISGNPSQRITELEAQGHEIHHKREHKGRRPGVRYSLCPKAEIAGNGAVAGVGVVPGNPCTPDPGGDSSAATIPLAAGEPARLPGLEPSPYEQIQDAA